MTCFYALTNGIKLSRVPKPCEKSCDMNDRIQGILAGIRTKQLRWLIIYALFLILSQVSLNKSINHLIIRCKQSLRVFILQIRRVQGTVKGKRKRGRQKKRWEDNIKEWTGMDFASSTRAAENRSRWKVVVANSSVVPRQPSKVTGSNRIE